MLNLLQVVTWLNDIQCWSGPVHGGGALDEAKWGVDLVRPRLEQQEPPTEALLGFLEEEGALSRGRHSPGLQYNIQHNQFSFPLQPSKLLAVLRTSPLNRGRLSLARPSSAGCFALGGAGALCHRSTASLPEDPQSCVTWPQKEPLTLIYSVLTSTSSPSCQHDQKEFPTACFISFLFSA